MPRVFDIVSQKGNRLHTIAHEVSVLQATQKMNQHGIGALVVMQDGHVVGMFTERDVLRRVVAEQRSPMDVTVAEVMTADVICVPPQMDIEDVSQIMKDKRVRHLP